MRLMVAYELVVVVIIIILSEELDNADLVGGDRARCVRVCSMLQTWALIAPTLVVVWLRLIAVCVWLLWLRLIASDCVWLRLLDVVHRRWLSAIAVPVGGWRMQKLHFGIRKRATSVDGEVALRPLTTEPVRVLVAFAEPAVPCVPSIPFGSVELEARSQPPIWAEELWSCSTVALPIGSRWKSS
jgi:hypothetical protein